MRPSFLVLTLILLLPRQALPHSAKEVSAQIEQLKAPNLSASDKSAISRDISLAGKTAIPPLIACEKDSTPIAQVPVTGGECVNRPGTLPTPPQCENPTQRETLGERCQDLLYQIITPPYTSPYMTPHTSKERPPPPFVIKDWTRWWNQYKGRSLSQIHEEAKKRIDQFYLQGGKGSVLWTNGDN